MEIISTFQTSVRKALAEIEPKYESLNGLIICGTHSPKDIEEHVRAAQRARTQEIPTLGICWGMQVMAIEYARNVVGFPGATTEEVSNSGQYAVKKLPELRVGIRRVDGWWGSNNESHWHNYAVVPDIVNSWEKSSTDGVLEVMRWPQHPFYVGVQFHPEYSSSKDKPHPLLVEFINVCRK